MTDADDKEYAFHISNNDGQSSLILGLKLHKDICEGGIYYDVTYERVGSRT